MKCQKYIFLHFLCNIFYVTCFLIFFQKNITIFHYLGVQINENSRIPFQSQINYLSNDGNKCLRVITNYQSYTKNKQKAEKEADVMFLHKVAAQKSSNWAQMGK